MVAAAIPGSEPRALSVAQARQTPRALLCRIRDLDGDELATGEAQLTWDEHGHLVATIHSIASVGALLLAIFARGQKAFLLDLPAHPPQRFDLVACRWLDGKQRVCILRSAHALAYSHLPVPA